MTLQEALDLTNQLKPNMMVRSTMVRFLNEIEGKVHREILMKHVHTAEEETCPEYDENTEGSTELLVEAPYDMLYVYYLMSKVDMLNQEEDKEYNDRVRFENAWDEFSDYWTREHMPLQTAPYYIF